MVVVVVVCGDGGGGVVGCHLMVVCVGMRGGSSWWCHLVVVCVGMEVEDGGWDGVIWWWRCVRGRGGGGVWGQTERDPPYTRTRMVKGTE